MFLQEWTDFMKNYRDKIATKKQAFISAKLESARSNDVKEKFRCLSNLLSEKARMALPTHTCDYRLANDFQHYFIQKINNIVNFLDKPVDEIYLPCLQHFSVFHELDESSLLKLLPTMSNATTFNAAVPTHILKSVVSSWLPFFHRICN